MEWIFLSVLSGTGVGKGVSGRKGERTFVRESERSDGCESIQ